MSRYKPRQSSFTKRIYIYWNEWKGSAAKINITVRGIPRLRAYLFFLFALVCVCKMDKMHFNNNDVIHLSCCNSRITAILLDEQPFFYISELLKAVNIPVRSHRKFNLERRLEDKMIVWEWYQTHGSDWEKLVSLASLERLVRWADEEGAPGNCGTVLNEIFQYGSNKWRRMNRGTPKKRKLTLSGLQCEESFDSVLMLESSSPGSDDDNNNSYTSQSRASCIRQKKGSSIYDFNDNSAFSSEDLIRLENEKEGVSFWPNLNGENIQDSDNNNARDSHNISREVGRDDSNKKRVKQDCIDAIIMGKILLDSISPINERRNAIVVDMLLNWELLSKCHVAREDSSSDAYKMIPVGYNVTISERLMEMGFLNTTIEDKMRIGKIASQYYLQRYERKPYQVGYIIDGQTRTRAYYSNITQDCIDSAIGDFFVFGE